LTVLLAEHIKISFKLETIHTDQEALQANPTK
jgi:calcium-dependent protein kinase